MVLSLQILFKAMNKKLLIILFAIVLSIGSAFGQIIYTDEDQGLHPRAGSSNPDLGVMVPLQNSNLDQWKEEYVPLADGLLLLVGMGGAYLLKKKRSKK